MADVLGEIIVEVKASQAKLDSDLKKIDSTLKNEGEKLGKTLGKNFSLGFNAISIEAVRNTLTEIFKFFAGAAQAYASEESAIKKLEQAYGKTTKALTEYANELQSKTAYEDDAIISAQSYIASFIKEEDAIKRVTKATLDFATIKGMKLDSAAQLITKSITSGTNALSRYGIKIEGTAGSAKRLNSVLEELEKRFGNQAASQLDTYAGKWDNLKNKFNDVYESIGKKTIDVLAAAYRSITSGQSFAASLFVEKFKTDLSNAASDLQEKADKNAPVVSPKILITITSLKDEIKTLKEELEDTDISDIASIEKLNKLIAAKQTIIDSFLKPIKKDIIDLLSREIDLYNELEPASQKWFNKSIELIKAQADEMVKAGLKKDEVTEWEKKQIQDLTTYYERLKISWDKVAHIGNVPSAPMIDWRSKNVKYRPPTDTVNYSHIKPTVDQYGLDWINKSLEEQKNLWGDLQSASSQAMGNLVSQWAGAINVIKNANSLLEQFINTLAQVGLQQLATYAIGSFSGGGILGGIASLFGGGSSSPGASAKPAIPIVQGGNKTNIMNWKVDNQSLLLSTESASKIKATYY